MDITAKLIKVFPQVERGTFTSRKIWLEVEPGQYPQTIEVEVSQKNVNIFTNIPVGATVTVSCNFRGKVTEWKGEQKCFWSLSVWRVQQQGAATTTQYNAQTGYAQQAAANTTHDAQQGSGYIPDAMPVDDGLPFNRPRTKPSLP